MEADAGVDNCRSWRTSIRKNLFGKLQAAGVKCDFREPNVIRAAPTPLYNSFHEVWRFAKILAEHQ